MRYRDAGVDIDRANRVKKEIKRLATRTFGKNVLGPIGGFGGLYRLGGIGRGESEGVLVASIDGIGTKLMLAFELDGHRRVGEDLVNHCVNDILVQGARPLFFLDYLATGEIEPETLKQIVVGLTSACRKAGCALIGGETAEMPGFYAPGNYDLAGCIVGHVEKRELIDGRRIRPGDVILGLPSAGLHTNGYSLARKVLLEQEGIPLGKALPELGRTLGAELLSPHRCYWPALEPLLGRGLLKGLVHVTGGGMTDNIPRVLPRGCRAEIHRRSWPALPIFSLIAKFGKVKDAEMFRTFNMGIGMILIVGQKQLPAVVRHLKRKRRKLYTLGCIRSGAAGVRYV